MNRIFAIGNIVKDAKLENVNVNGMQTPRCRFSVAENGTRSNGEAVTTYFEVTLWRDYAVKMAPWLLKGRQVHIEGKVRLNQYIDANRNVRTSLQISSPTVTLLGKKPDTEDGELHAEELFDDDELPFS